VYVLSGRLTLKSNVDQAGQSVNYEAWNGYVLVAIGLFGMVFYMSLLYAGITEFRSRVSKSNSHKKRSRNRVTSGKLRNPKVPVH